MASILFPNASPIRTPKMHVTTGKLQPYIDPKQIPTKRPPWRQISETSFAKTAVLTMPSKLFETTWSKIATRYTRCKYAKVFLKLEDILTGEFFNDYLKIGNVLMVSEGVPGVDDLYTICDGILRLDLGKDTYQRAGLQGTVLKNHGGKKHSKERYLIELNLRSTSMVRGKKGFERLLYAAKNALNHTKTWLFRDLMPPVTAPKSLPTTSIPTATSTLSLLSSSSSSSGISEDTKGMVTEKTQNQHSKGNLEGPIAKHHPQVFDNEPEIHDLNEPIIPDILSNTAYFPPFAVRPAPEDHALYYEITEWLSLVNMQSPRVQSSDHPDPYISRYTVPFVDDENRNNSSNNTTMPISTPPTKLKVIRWTGLIDPQWIVNLLIEIIKQTRTFKCQDWIALTVTTHPTEALGQIDGYTMLLQPDLASPSIPSGEEGDDDDNDDGSADAMDVDVHVDTTKNSTEDDFAVPSSKRSGLQIYTCFQFVDS